MLAIENVVQPAPEFFLSGSEGGLVATEINAATSDKARKLTIVLVRRDQVARGRALAEFGFN